VLDVLRAAGRSPDSLETFFTELDSGRGADPRLDGAIDRAKRAIDGTVDLEFEARRVVESMAVAWAGTLLARSGDAGALDAFAASRLAETHGGLYGTLPAGADVARLVDRATPAL
jgi:putative acyl-CoA dehydrogenase